MTNSQFTHILVYIMYFITGNGVNVKCSIICDLAKNVFIKKKVKYSQEQIFYAGRSVKNSKREICIEIKSYNFNNNDMMITDD